MSVERPRTSQGEDKLMASRVERLRELFAPEGVEGLMVSKPENRAYLSGFTGSAGILLITERDAFLVTDFRYEEQAAAQAPDFKVVKHGAQMMESLKELLDSAGVRRIGFERDFVTFGTYEQYRDKLAPVELVPVDGVTEKLRLKKDASEIETIRKAVAIGDEAFNHILKFIEPGQREEDIALELEFAMRKAGAQGRSFDIIVASGPRSSLPHGVASDRVVQDGEFIEMDFGCVYRGYCSDMTRTVVLGEPDEKQREIYEIVLEAQLAALDAARPGITGTELDAVARKIIADRGYGENFGHGLGHGVGRVIHEGPRVSLQGDQILEPGMVVTIEPGIYIPGWGGVRIEDMVVITETGREVLTGSPKELIVL